MKPATSHRDRVTTFAAPAAVGALLVALWHVSVAYSGTRVFPSPAAVGAAVAELLRKGLLIPYTFDSLGRVMAGYGAAIAAGVPLGLIMGWHVGAASALNPVIQLLRPISPLAWMPVAVVLLGVGNAPAILLIGLGAFFPIVVAAMNAVASVREVHLRVARNFGLPPVKVLLHVMMPASLPQLLVGLRLALGIAWLVVVAAEMLAIDSGLGYLVVDSRNAGKRYDLVVAAMVSIGLIGFTLDIAMRFLARATAGRWSKAV